jgi:hypothetical protein
MCTWLKSGPEEMKTNGEKDHAKRNEFVSFSRQDGLGGNQFFRKAAIKLVLL